ncbi:pimeloyl-ACP methyl ester carboxylesterase [Devosia sp. UYZn731]|uniref:alpha/beta fold hydrolase n=1 Tax=Devosia sp. UYZn731 TaxID=3156345 RepID=UPI003392E246
MFVTQDGVSLNVEQVGIGQPFVFQHGLGGDSRQTAEVFPQGQGFRMVTIECRGHGKSEAGSSSAFSIQPFADDVADFITKSLPAPVVLGGISMGAAISLNLAVRRPELIKGLVVARPAWLFDDSPENMAPNAVAGQILAANPSETALEVFEHSSTAEQLGRVSPDNLNSLRGFFSRANRDIFAQMLMRIAADGPKVTRSDLASLTLPALVIGTDQDYVHPFSHARSLAEAIPNAKLVKVTSKSVSRAQYVSQFQAELAVFLQEVKDAAQ